MRSRASTPHPHAAPGHAHEGGALLRGDSVEAVQAHALRLARQVAEREQTCLFVSARNPRTLAAHAADDGFDLAQASRDGRFRLLPLPDALLAESDSDDARTQALADLTTVAQRRRPDYLIVEDAVPLAGFADADWFDAAFAAMHDRLAETGTAFILMMAGLEGGPAHARLGSHVAHRHTLPAPRPPVSRGDGMDRARQHDPSLPELSVPTSHAAAPPTPQLSPALEYPDLRLFKASPERETPQRGEQAVSIGRGHYVAADATLPDSVHAATHLNPLDRALLGGTTVEAHSDGDGASEPVTLDSGLFEAVNVQQALEAFETPSRVEGWAALTASQSPRITFVRGFNDALDEHRAEGTPFMALALRMPEGHPAGRRFHFAISAIRRTLGPDDLVLADEPGRRVVVLLRKAGNDATQALFATIRSDLYAATAEANHVLETVKAVVVPNGAPFPNATEFLAHAYD